jgi:23S rRNA (uracil1939-C5)-methyltransferase
MGEIITVEVTDLAFDGKAVGQNDGKVVFMNAGLPGETVEAEITRCKPRYDHARVTRIIDRAPERIEAPCQHFDICGGCAWQDLQYDQQLKYKEKQVADCLARLGHLEDVQVLPIMPAEEQFFYRNKMEFSFNVADSSFRLGLHERGRFDSIFDVEQCHLQSESSNRIVAAVREWVVANEVPVYDIMEQIGYMRFLVVREGKRTGQIMVNVVTNLGPLPDQGGLIELLTKTVPEITTVLHSQTGSKGNVAVGEIETVLTGPGYIEEQLFDKRFRIRSNSFFQTNSNQAERLYQTGFDMLSASPDDRIMDLYCGTGTIGLLLADRVKEVIGVELVEDAVRAAHQNAELNNVTNISFYQGHVKEYLRTEAADAGEIHAVIVDPPRAGMNPKALRRLIRMHPPKLLYISCNPATFARDAAELTKQGYQLPAVQPVDMFPHTMHVELVGLFIAQ